MLHLYEHPLSPYAQKIKIALHEKGLAFEASTPNLFGVPDDAFKQASPRLEVPTLVDGDVVLFDSTIILEYLEERWPEPALLPRAPAERARARMLEDLCDTYFEAITWGLAEIRAFGRARGELAERLIGRAKQQIEGLYGYLERQIGDAPFFDGEAFGRGDLSLVPHVASAAANGFAPPAGSKLAGWFGRAGERESVKRCLTAAREAMAQMPDLPKLVESGAITRLYRDHRLEWMMRSGGSQIVLDGVEKRSIRFAVELR